MKILVLSTSRKGKPRKTHGMSGTNIYACWKSMMNRCYKKWCHAYPDYGGRGIRVCSRWRSFSQFFEDMGPMPQGHCIDRINNNGNYTPGNCRWITKAEGNKNKRTVRKLVVEGNTYSVPELAKKFSMNKKTLRCRLDNGWDLDKALKTPSLSPYQKGLLAAAARWGFHA